MIQLKITIDGITPPIWRSLQVPDSYPLYKLHHIIQIAFGWENSNAWCFWIEETPTTNPMLWGGGVTRWDKRVLSEYEKLKRGMIQQLLKGRIRVKI